MGELIDPVSETDKTLQKVRDEAQIVSNREELATAALTYTAEAAYFARQRK